MRSNERNCWVFLSALDATEIAHIDTGFGGELLLTKPTRRPQTPDIDPDYLFPSHPAMGWESPLSV